MPRRSRTTHRHSTPPSRHGIQLRTTSIRAISSVPKSSGGCAGHCRTGPARWTPDRTDDARLPRPLSRIESPSSAYQPASVRPAADEGFAEVKDRLDDLKRQLESIARPQSAVPPASGQDEAARQFADVISKLDHKLDQLITDNKATKSEIEQRMQGVKRAVADLDPESQRARLPAAARDAARSGAPGDRRSPADARRTTV